MAAVAGRRRQSDQPPAAGTAAAATPGGVHGHVPDAGPIRARVQRPLRNVQHVHGVRPLRNGKDVGMLYKAIRLFFT